MLKINIKTLFYNLFVMMTHILKLFSDLFTIIILIALLSNKENLIFRLGLIFLIHFQTNLYFILINNSKEQHQLLPFRKLGKDIGVLKHQPK